MEKITKGSSSPSFAHVDTLSPGRHTEGAVLLPDQCELLAQRMWPRVPFSPEGSAKLYNLLASPKKTGGSGEPVVVKSTLWNVVPLFHQRLKWTSEVLTDSILCSNPSNRVLCLRLKVKELQWPSGPSGTWPPPPCLLHMDPVTLPSLKVEIQCQIHKSQRLQFSLNRALMSK